MEQNTTMDAIIEGVEVIEKVLRKIRKPADKKAMETAKETITTIKKQYKAMKKDDAIRIQYEDKVAYSTIQLMFQVLHLGILARVDNQYIDMVVGYVQTHDSVYELAERIRKAAEARADFTPQRKQMM